jgi:predicted transcriptional regulator
MPQLPRPTEAELSILQVLWERGPLSVREVLAGLQKNKPTGYTTALKLMQIMTSKGLLDRDDSVRPQIYRARHGQAQTQRQMVNHLVERAFGGSVRSLVLQALSSRKPTLEELSELDSLLDRIEGGKES